MSCTKPKYGQTCSFFHCLRITHLTSYVGPRLHPQPLDLVGQRAAAVEPPGGAQLQAARGQPAARQDDAQG